MSAFSVEAAHIERLTAIHRHTSARILTIYVEQGPISPEACFPVSGDMLAVLTSPRAPRTAKTRRRRRASLTCLVAEADA